MSEVGRGRQQSEQASYGETPLGLEVVGTTECHGQRVAESSSPSVGRGFPCHPWERRLGDASIWWRAGGVGSVWQIQLWFQGDGLGVIGPKGQTPPIPAQPPKGFAPSPQRHVAATPWPTSPSENSLAHRVPGMPSPPLPLLADPEAPLLGSHLIQ